MESLQHILRSMQQYSEHRVVPHRSADWPHRKSRGTFLPHKSLRPSHQSHSVLSPLVNPPILVSTFPFAFFPSPLFSASLFSSTDGIPSCGSQAAPPNPALPTCSSSNRCRPHPPNQSRFLSLPGKAVFSIFPFTSHAIVFFLFRWY